MFSKARPTERAERSNEELVLSHIEGNDELVLSHEEGNVPFCPFWQILTTI